MKDRHTALVTFNRNVFGRLYRVCVSIILGVIMIMGTLAMGLGLSASETSAQGFESTIGVSTASPAVDAALTWLRDQQSDIHGGYGGQWGTANVLLAVGASQSDPDQWRRGDSAPSIIDYWSRDEYAYGAANNATAYASQNAGGAGLLALAVAGAGKDPQNFADLNLVISLTNYFDPGTGAFDENNHNQIWAILGWRAALTDTVPVPITATQRLSNSVSADGGWGWSSTAPSDSNVTALAIQALIAGGQSATSTRIISGLAYLKSTQNTDGGFGYTSSSDSDTNSTAWALQALLAAGQDPSSAEWTINVTDPISFLLSMQLPGGGFKWQATGTQANLLATAQAVSALLCQPFPLHLNSPDPTLCRLPGQQAPGRNVWLPIVLKQD
jgi:hypothetical protein